MSGYASMMRSMEKGRGSMGPMGPMMSGMGMGPAAATRKGIDKRSTNRGDQRKEETKAVETAKGPSLFDPYYDIVEVKVYGQARFYNPPPADAQIEPSPGETAANAAEPAEAKSAAASGAEPAAKPEPAKPEPAKAEPAKVERPKPSRQKLSLVRPKHPRPNPARLKLRKPSLARPQLRKPSPPRRRRQEPAWSSGCSQGLSESCCFTSLK